MPTEDEIYKDLEKIVQFGPDSLGRTRMDATDWCERLGIPPTKLYLLSVLCSLVAKCSAAKGSKITLNASMLQGLCVLLIGFIRGGWDLTGDLAFKYGKSGVATVVDSTEMMALPDSSAYAAHLKEKAAYAIGNALLSEGAVEIQEWYDKNTRRHHTQFSVVYIEPAVNSKKGRTSGST